MIDKTAVEKLIKKSQQFPALAHTYAAELDRLFRAAGEKPVTFSATAWAIESKETVKRVGLQTRSADAVEITERKLMLTAEALMKEGKRGDAFAHAFTHASGPQVNALNLFYANHASQSTSTRLYYLSKYLSAYDLGITLKDATADFFQRITSTDTPAKVDGPLVTVIMPAHNAENTIELALGSLLNQSWRNLQIIVVDDASTDGTLQKAKELAKRDYRIEVLRSPVNVGPYVCRNLGVLHTRGKWLTVHDADDWAFPDRIEQQVKALIESSAVSCTGCMLRMENQGKVTRPAMGATAEEDGYLRLSFVSLMVQTNYFREKLGAWDSVRVGGDAELMERLKVMAAPKKHIRRPLMFCLDHKDGLTNHEELGLLDKGGSEKIVRTDYKRAFKVWHAAKGQKKLSAFGKHRSFDAPKANIVDQLTIDKIFAAWKKNVQLIKSSELFDAEWYARQYPEVAHSGLGAAEHYLLYGVDNNYHPSSNFDLQFYLNLSRKTNPLIYIISGRHKKIQDNRVLLAASHAAKSDGYERALNLAEKNLPEDLKYTAHILHANASLAKGNQVAWLGHLNSYLANFNVTPVILDAGHKSIFDRLSSLSVSHIVSGPLISVIMPAFNSEKSVRKAAQSILNQSWRNIELLIVDDCSSDNTWGVLQEIANADDRVRIFRNRVNVGPYVSKNIALTHCNGEWITGHDADDWAFPQRLEQHIKEAMAKGFDASLAYMIRMTSDGNFSHISQLGGFTIDCVTRLASISCLFKRSVLVGRLGYWDTVRFGADSEMIYRARKLLGSKFGVVRQISMICQDLETSLTNHATLGVNKKNGISSIRAEYRDAWTARLNTITDFDAVYLEFPQKVRRYDAPIPMVVPVEHIEANLH